jgi:hypothetical protein
MFSLVETIINENGFFDYKILGNRINAPKWIEYIRNDCLICNESGKVFCDPESSKYWSEST